MQVTKTVGNEGITPDLQPSNYGYTILLGRGLGINPACVHKIQLLSDSDQIWSDGSLCTAGLSF